MNCCARFFIFLIHVYRATLSPYIGNQCRFYPSCSHYAEEAIVKYGVIKGLWLGFKRICRCNPFCSGGYDPLPDLSQENLKNHHD